MMDKQADLEMEVRGDMCVRVYGRCDRGVDLMGWGSLKRC